ncbi:hypothetical protein GCM10029992_25460 [Glycomyces albus]
MQRITRQARIAVLVRMVISVSFIFAAMVLLRARDRASIQVAAIMDEDPMLDSSRYNELIDAVVDLNYVPVAVGCLILSAILVVIAFIEFRRGFGVSIVGWAIWGVSVVAACIISFGARSGFSLRPGLNFDLVYSFFDRIEIVSVDLAMAIVGIDLFVLLPIANILSFRSVRSHGSIETSDLGQKAS